jgi:dienelactone hydrolase
MTRPVTEDDPLNDFDAKEITLEDTMKIVHVSGEGPAVIVMPEMPGISPHVARFARWVRDAGHTVYMPSLFGRDGVLVDAQEAGGVFKRTCVSAEFHALAGKGASPVTSWLRAPARLAHEECGGPGVGAIGMCFTGNFALSMMLEPAMLAPVLSQPSLPMDDPGGVESSDEELLAVKERLDQDDLTVMAYRFEGDAFCQAKRFEAYARALGERFVPHVLSDEAAASEDLPPFHEAFVKTPHSVMTAHLIDEAGHPTIAARDEVLEFFAARLGRG